MKQRGAKAFQTILKNRTYHGGILAPGSGLIKKGESGKGLKSRWYPQTLANRIRSIGKIRNRFTFICGDGISVMKDCIDDKNAAFFIDPPYTAGNQKSKRAGRRLYTHHEIDHDLLFDISEKSSGNILLTYENSPDIEELSNRHSFKTKCVAMKNTHHDKITELLISRDLHWFK
ncbi:MAG: hypothetical protein HQL73_10985 [Magnetococcales bacterium]|nr:hypothetical protein [Magnetococcales bacterium]